MANRLSKSIVSTAGIIGEAVGAFQKARDNVLRKPNFISGLAQASSWDGGNISNSEQAQLRAARNSWIYVGVNKKALDLSSAKFNVYYNPSGLEDDGEVAEGHPFMKVLRRPNPYMGRSLLFQYTEWWMDLAGEAFWFVEPGTFEGGKGIKGIWPLPSHRMDIEFTDDMKSIKSYILKMNQWYRIDPEYIIHFKYPNPWDFFRGMPPLVAFMLTIDADLAMKMWNGAFFGKDNTMPSAVISLGSGDPANMFEQSDIDAVRDELRNEYSAIRRKTVVTNANAMSVALLGYNAKDMDFLAGMAWNKDEILLGLGVPPGMVDKNSTEANAKVGNKDFKDVMWGIKNLLADEITVQVLQKHYNEALELRPDDDRVYDREAELAEFDKAKEVMTEEELREKYFQLPPLAEGQMSLSAGRMVQKQEQEEENKKKFEGTKNTVPSKNTNISKKHLGPGNHPSGSSQDVHGSGAKGFTKELMETVGSEHLIDKTSIVISEGDEILGTVQMREGWKIDGKESMYFNVHVAESDRRKGYGTRIISRIKELADKNDVVLYGSVSAFGSGKKMNDKQLMKWYESQGFIIGDKPGMYGNVYYFPGQQTVIKINRKPKKSVELEDEFESLFRKARNSFKNKGHSKITFNPDVLEPELVKSILHDLSGCETREDIGTVYWQYEPVISSFQDEGIVKGGIGSGEKEGHPFRGNQWTGKKLLHGTSRENALKILKEGLLISRSVDKHFIFTTNELDTAIHYGSRLGKIFAIVSIIPSEELTGPEMNPYVNHVYMFDRDITPEEIVSIKVYEQGNEEPIEILKSMRTILYSVIDLTEGISINLHEEEVNKNMKSFSYRPWSGFENTLVKVIYDALQNVLEILLNNASETLPEDGNVWQQIAEVMRQAMLPTFQSIATKAAQDIQKMLGQSEMQISYDLTNSRAIEWATNYAGTQIANISNTTKDAVRRAIAEWIANGRAGGIQDLRDRLQKITDKNGVGIFSEARARRIAQSEATSVYAGATEAGLVANGYPPAVYKPRAHVNCRCYIQPGRLPNGEKVIIWYTARDEMVCTMNLETPFGNVKGCRELHRKIVSEGRAGQQWEGNLWNPEKE